ncbi:bifunctional nuclease family protein [Oleidesulfovibrio alaskensis]|uniref:bifunctional nuclease family protein n=1 Tax=Oleidesulfovibrio alaskensis TaxID=58180 RepID=UPI00040FAA34|nr:bifunctional nuclease family protein [Oleidesulfovibrio alaskensis]
MLIEMKVLGLSLDETSKAPILILQQKDGKDVLPIWVGAMEAMAISIALNEVETPRPLTHDLMLSTLSSLGARLVSVNVTGLREGTYYAELEITCGSTLSRVDSRPSDAVALALRAGAPIRVSDEVLRLAEESRLKPSQGDPALLRRPADAAASFLRPEEAEKQSDEELEELLRKLDPVTKYKM